MVAHPENYFRSLSFRAICDLWCFVYSALILHGWRNNESLCSTKQLAVAPLTNILHAANKLQPHSHTVCALCFCRVPVNSGIVHKSVHEKLIWVEVGLTPGISRKPCNPISHWIRFSRGYTSNSCSYRSSDATVLMTSTPNITQLECAVIKCKGITLHTRIIHHSLSESEQERTRLFLSTGTDTPSRLLAYCLCFSADMRSVYQGTPTCVFSQKQCLHLLARPNVPGFKKLLVPRVTLAEFGLVCHRS